MSLKTYVTRLNGALRKEFEEYISSQGMNEAEALRECIRCHVRNKTTTPEVQTRLRTIEGLLRELNGKQ